MNNITITSILNAVADITLAIENIKNSPDDINKALNSYQLSLLQALTLLYTRAYSTENISSQILESQGIIRNKLGEPTDYIKDEESLAIKIISIIAEDFMFIGSLKTM